MRILYHHRTASKDGQAVHIDEMVGALRALGHEVRIVAPQTSDGDGMGAKVGWVHQLRDRLPKVGYELLELGYSVIATWRLWRAAREFRPDFIYERYNLYLISAVLLRRALGVPVLLEVNSPLVDERMAFGGLGWPWLGRWAEGVAWRGADVVLPVTQVLGESVRAAGVPAQRIVVIPNGVNEAHFAGTPAPAAAKAALGWDGALVLGFVGFVRDWHGVDRVLRWMASADAPAHTRLLLVGDGPARAGLEALAADLGLADRLRVTGVVSREALPSLLAAFDIALQPAVTPYASPLKLFEYLVLGQAVVAPDTPNIREILRDGDNGLLCAPDDEPALHRALTALAGDTALRQRLGQRARATIDEQNLTWRGNAQKVLQLARTLRGETGPAATARPGPPDTHPTHGR